MNPSDDLRDRMAELERLNAELNNLVQQMLSSTDELFRSQTWRIGYAIAGSIRWILHKLGKGGMQGYIRPNYFHQMVERCYAYQKRPTGTKLTGAATDIPPQYVHTDVDTALRDLWEAVGKEYAHDK